nr:hypothetical protein [uncultured Roseovarius sp.]
MLSIFAKSFLTATRSETTNHWGDYQRFDTRKDAEVEAHTVARRRD